MIDRPSGTEGYAAEAPALARQYESIAFAQVHRQVMFLIPPAPARISIWAPAPDATRLASPQWDTR